MRGEALPSPAGTRGSERLVAALAWVTVAGIVLYLMLTITAQLLPPHYSPIRDAESDLAVGPYGYLMTIAFVLRGLVTFALIAALARGLPLEARSRAGLILLGDWAAGSLLLAMFPADVAAGAHTTHGRVHLVVALLAFIAAAAAELAISARLSSAPWPAAGKRAAKLLSYLTALTLAVFIFMSGRPRVFGFFERLFLGAALLWMLVVAVQLALADAGGRRHQKRVAARR